MREDGTVKVLDFGLAKALDTTPAGDPDQSPTLTAAGTEMGVIMGTAAYMSPEQAPGKAVDRRADIWAFGAIVYEMLTARQPFEGKDVSLTLSKVLQSEPEWRALPEAVPPGLRLYLRLCLKKKDPRERIRDIGDVTLALDGAFDVTASGEGVSESPAYSASAWRQTLPWGLAAMLAIAVGGLSWLQLARDAAPPTAPIRFAIPPPRGGVLSLQKPVMSPPLTAGPRRACASSSATTPRPRWCGGGRAPRRTCTRPWFVVEMLAAGSALMGAEQPAFQERSDSMDMGQEDVSRLNGFRDHRHPMIEAERREAPIRRPAVREDGAVFVDHITHEAEQIVR